MKKYQGSGKLPVHRVRSFAAALHARACADTRGACRIMAMRITLGEGTGSTIAGPNDHCLADLARGRGYREMTALLEQAAPRTPS